MQVRNHNFFAGFPTVVENMGGGTLHNLMGGALVNAWGQHGGLKMMLKNTCEGVNLKVKLPAISLQTCKFTKNEFLHTHFSRILTGF